MTEAARKISLNFRRVKDVAGMANATLGVVAVQVARAAAGWQMPETEEELRQEMSRLNAFLNDRDFKGRMVETAEQIEKMQKEVEALEDQIDEIRQKFSLAGLFTRRRDIAAREEEIRDINAELSELRAQELEMHKTRDAASQRYDEMDKKLCNIEGPGPRKPLERKSPSKGFKL